MAVKVKCMNDKCNNYKQELNEGVEICSLCNEPVTVFESKVNDKMQMIAIIAAIVGPVVFTFGFYPWFWAGLAMSPASVVLGVISRSKAAVIISILSVIANIGLMFMFFFS